MCGWRRALARHAGELDTPSAWRRRGSALSAACGAGAPERRAGLARHRVASHHVFLGLGGATKEQANTSQPDSYMYSVGRVSYYAKRMVMTDGHLRRPGAAASRPPTEREVGSRSSHRSCWSRREAVQQCLLFSTSDLSMICRICTANRLLQRRGHQPSKNGWEESVWPHIMICSLRKATEMLRQLRKWESQTRISTSWGLVHLSTEESSFRIQHHKHCTLELFRMLSRFRRRMLLRF